MPDNIMELEKELANASVAEHRLSILLQLLHSVKETEYVDGWKYGIEALELANKLRDRESIAQAHEGLANCLWKLAEYAEALERYEVALDNYLSQGDLHGAARCYCGMGIVLGTLENYRGALDHFDDGLSAAKRAGKHELAATLVGNIGHIYFNLGNYPDAMKCFQNSYEFCKESGSSSGAANMLGGMAGIHVYQGEHHKGLELVRRGLLLHKEDGNVRGVAVAMMNIGISLQKMGKLKQAKKELKSALNYARSIDLKMTEHSILKILSEVCSQLEEHNEANKYLELYLDAQHDEKKLAVQRKSEQFRQRQMIREMQDKSS